MCWCVGKMSKPMVCCICTKGGVLDSCGCTKFHKYHSTCIPDFSRCPLCCCQHPDCRKRTIKNDRCELTSTEKRQKLSCGCLFHNECIQDLDSECCPSCGQDVLSETQTSKTTTTASSSSQPSLSAAAEQREALVSMLKSKKVVKEEKVAPPKTTSWAFWSSSKKEESDEEEDEEEESDDEGGISFASLINPNSGTKKTASRKQKSVSTTEDTSPETFNFPKYAVNKEHTDNIHRYLLYIRQQEEFSFEQLMQFKTHLKRMIDTNYDPTEREFFTIFAAAINKVDDEYARDVNFLKFAVTNVPWKYLKKDISEQLRQTLVDTIQEPENEADIEFILTEKFGFVIADIYSPETPITHIIATVPHIHGDRYNLIGVTFKELFADEHFKRKDLTELLSDMSIEDAVKKLRLTKSQVHNDFIRLKLKMPAHWTPEELQKRKLIDIPVAKRT